MNWKKQLIKELDEHLKPLDETVKNVPIEKPQTNVASFKRKKIRLTVISSLAVAAVICIILSCVFLLPTDNNAMSTESVLTIEINPAATFVADKDGIVTNVIALNSDADVLLSNSETKNSIIGNKLLKSVNIFTDYAAKLGYLDFSTNGDAVKITSNNENNLETVEESLKNYFMEKGIAAVVVTDKVDVSVLCEKIGIDTKLNFSELVKTLKVKSTFNYENLSSESTENISAQYKEILCRNSNFANYAKEQIIQLLNKTGNSLIIDLLNLEDKTLSEIFDLMENSRLKDHNLSQMLTFLNMPSNKQEYANKLTLMCEEIYSLRQSQYKSVYETKRPPLSKKDYEKIVGELIGESGLSGYWKGKGLGGEQKNN